MLTVTELGINPPPCTDHMVVNILVTFVWFRLAPPQTALFAMKRLGRVNFKNNMAVARAMFSVIFLLYFVFNADGQTNQSFVDTGSSSGVY
jgi:uncharacterized membrane protein YozB (DUF420 family)